VNRIFSLFFLYLPVAYASTARCTEKYMGKIIRIFTQSPFCVLNFTLPACRPKFAEVACTTQMAQRVCSNKYFVIFDCNHGSCTPQFIKVHTTNVFYIIICYYWGRGYKRKSVLSAEWIRFSAWSSMHRTSKINTISIWIIWVNPRNIEIIIFVRGEIPFQSEVRRGYFEWLADWGKIL